MNVGVLKVNAFTDSRTGGNPAGVVVDSPDLTDEQMKQISKELVVSETAFIFPSKKADCKVRFFSPDVEVDLCGHATIASFFALAHQGRWNVKSLLRVTQETKVGILPVDISFTNKKTVERVMMAQSKPIYKNIHFNISIIADALNVDLQDINDSFPQQLVSTGLFTLPLCIRSFDVLKTMVPDFKKVKAICEQIRAGSIHVFTFETLDPDSVYHARNFAPVYGINEDPVTGTANGAVSNYLFHHHFINKKKIICEQGDIIGRPGRVIVEIDHQHVKVGGRAKIVEEKMINV